LLGAKKQGARNVTQDKPNVQLDAAEVILTATVNFLIRHGVSESWVRKKIGEVGYFKRPNMALKRFDKVYLDYHDMGAILATWFSRPEYLDSEGRPLALSVTQKNGPSIRSLIRDANVAISYERAVSLLRTSPSIRKNRKSRLKPMWQVFVLDNFEVPRAAKVISRYLETVNFNSNARRKKDQLLLERDCCAIGLKPDSVRDLQAEIRYRSKSYLNAVDQKFESLRLRNGKKRTQAEVGLMVFSWNVARKKGARRRT
jgi:hypothetical protein